MLETSRWSKKMAIEISKRINKNVRVSPASVASLWFYFLNVSSLRASECLQAWRCGHGGSGRTGEGQAETVWAWAALVDLLLYYSASLLNVLKAIWQWIEMSNSSSPGTQTTSGSIYLHSILLHENMSHVAPVSSQERRRCSNSGVSYAKGKLQLQ